ncbi:MAG: M48 family metallopeptidase [Ruminococcaceae bacterium]|nr:M48 family metallopeptidase [Oscillospiraceae bacterium]
MNETKRTVVANGRSYTYKLTHKRVKNAIMRITPDAICVSAPTHMPLSAVDSFVTKNADAIERARQKFAAREAARPKPLSLVAGESISLWGISHPIAVERSSKRAATIRNGALVLSVKDPDDADERYRTFLEFTAREAARMLTARTATLTPLFAPKPPSPPALVFRTMTSRWGVCRPTVGRVTLNRRLIFLPIHLVDYVICHELAHFHHADHSTAFWQALADVMPDCKQRRKALNDYPLPVFLQESAKKP